MKKTANQQPVQQHKCASCAKPLFVKTTAMCKDCDSRKANPAAAAAMVAAQEQKRRALEEKQRAEKAALWPQPPKSETHQCKGCTTILSTLLDLCASCHVEHEKEAYRKKYADDLKFQPQCATPNCSGKVSPKAHHGATLCPKCHMEDIYAHGDPEEIAHAQEKRADTLISLGLSHKLYKQPLK